MKIAIVGSGPAGMRAAEVVAAAGFSVPLFESMPSVGRKLLVAGVGGLNLTNAGTRGQLANHYTGPEMPGPLWDSMLADFDAEAVRTWAAGLGVETFAASSRRVYPVGLKAAPLLRRWVDRLRGLGVEFRLRHRWAGFAPTPSPEGVHRLLFTDRNGDAVVFEAHAVILAMGGASWPQTGSTGAWVELLEQHGIGVAPLQPSNCGWELDWPARVLEQAEGKPLKNIVARAGEKESAGELLITNYGLEGGALYALGPALRALHNERGSAELRLDLKPAFSVEQLVAKLGAMGKAPSHEQLLREARVRWRLAEAAAAILESRGPFTTPVALAQEAKDCRLSLTGPRPLAEAISSAGGVRWSELNGELMLRRMPGIFVAGEMIDWDAPTGGYLIQGCLSTGTRAAKGAIRWLEQPR